MDELRDEYEAWLEEQKLPKASVEELLMTFGTIDAKQREWLMEFEQRWDRQQAIVDRLAVLA